MGNTFLTPTPEQKAAALAEADARRARLEAYDALIRRHEHHDACIRAWMFKMDLYDPSADKCNSQLVANILVDECHCESAMSLHLVDVPLTPFLLERFADDRLARLVGSWQAKRRAEMGLPPLGAPAPPLMNVTF
jgi:hypothetical protein